MTGILSNSEIFSVPGSSSSLSDSQLWANQIFCGCEVFNVCYDTPVPLYLPHTPILIHNTAEQRSRDVNLSYTCLLSIKAWCQLQWIQIKARATIRGFTVATVSSSHSACESLVTFLYFTLYSTVFSVLCYCGECFLLKMDA